MIKIHLQKKHFYDDDVFASHQFNPWLAKRDTSADPIWPRFSIFFLAQSPVLQVGDARSDDPELLHMQVDANSSKAINNNQVRIGGSPEIKTSLFAATPVEKRPDKRKNPARSGGIILASRFAKLLRMRWGDQSLNGDGL